MVLKEDVIVRRDMKFSLISLQKALRCLARMGFFPTEVEFEIDDLSMTNEVRIVMEHTMTTFNLKALLPPLVKELVEEDLQIEMKQTQIEILVVDTNKAPLREIQSIYEPLGVTVVVGAYGTIDVAGQLSYVFSLSLSGNTKKACLKYLLPNEVISGGELIIPQKATYDVFSLPDRTKILFSKKSDTCFIVDDRVVMFGKASFLKSVLPESGWFVKLNKKIGKSETILLLESSWELTKTQKSYVARNIA